MIDASTAQIFSDPLPRSADIVAIGGGVIKLRDVIFLKARDKKINHIKVKADC
jgi:hypothetical protein